MESMDMLVYHRGFYMVTCFTTSEFYAITWLALRGEGREEHVISSITYSVSKIAIKWLNYSITVLS